MITALNTLVFFRNHYHLDATSRDTN